MPALISQMVGFVQAVLGVMLSVITVMPWWERAANWGLMVIILGIAGATFHVIQYKISAVVGSLLAIGIGAAVDLYDN